MIFFLQLPDSKITAGPAGCSNTMCSSTVSHHNLESFGLAHWFRTHHDIYFPLLQTKQDFIKT